MQVNALRGRGASGGGQNVSLYYSSNDDGPAVTFSHASPFGNGWNSLLIRVDAVEGTAVAFLGCEGSWARSPIQ